jgi:hypothetical protein
MAKQHQTTLRSKAYLVGKPSNVTWGEYWDAYYFLDNSTKMSFVKVIHDMNKVNPNVQKNGQHVMRMLLGSPYN